MKNRYHYDKDGKLKGYSSDEAPSNGCSTMFVLFLIILFATNSIYLALVGSLILAIVLEAI